MCERCEELEERIRWLESELGIQKDADVFARLRNAMRRATDSNHQGRYQAAELVAALYAAGGRPLSRWQLLEAVPSPSGNDDRNPKIIDVWVCFARKTLGRDGILNVWGKGYQLSAAGRERVQAILAEGRVA